MQFRAVVVVDSAPAPRGPGRGAEHVTALEHVANRPIVQHVLDGLIEARVDEVILAGSADALIDIRASTRMYESRFASVEYAPCRDGVGLAGTLTAVAPLVGDAPCLLQPADGLLDAPVEKLVGLLEYGTPDLLLFSAPDAERPLHGGDDRCAENDLRRNHLRIVDVGRIVDMGGIADTGGIVDIGVFAAGALSRAIKTVRQVGSNDLASAGHRLAADGASVQVHPVDGWRRYRGNGRDLLELNRVALDRIGTDPPSSFGTMNRLEGRVLIDPTATVRDSVIIGPSVIGAGATVNESYIGAYTSIGAGARIEGTEIERSIVAPGASVLHVGGRLISSLVGRDARVFRDFSLPRGLRLWVSDGDEVALS